MCCLIKNLISKWYDNLRRSIPLRYTAHDCDYFFGMVFIFYIFFYNTKILRYLSNFTQRFYKAFCHAGVMQIHSCFFSLCSHCGNLYRKPPKIGAKHYWSLLVSKLYLFRHYTISTLVLNVLDIISMYVYMYLSMYGVHVNTYDVHSTIQCTIQFTNLYNIEAMHTCTCTCTMHVQYSIKHVHYCRLKYAREIWICSPYISSCILITGYTGHRHWTVIAVWVVQKK